MTIRLYNFLVYAVCSLYPDLQGIMSKRFPAILSLIPIGLASVLLTLEAAKATEAIEESLLIDSHPHYQAQSGRENLEDLPPVDDLQLESDPIEPINPVHQFSDVQPEDWAFEALQLLNDRYNCLAGYPDGTFRGDLVPRALRDRAVTRYEFAAALNACIQTKLEFATKDDLMVVERLAQDFAREMEALEERIDQLDRSIPEPFSTTTTLQGKVTLALSSYLGGGEPDPDEALDSQVVFSNRVDLTFLTSFGGKDRLKLRLRTRNASSLADVAGTDMARLAWEGEDESQVVLSGLEYSFPLGDRVTGYMFAEGGGLRDFTEEVDLALDPLSRFGQGNPLYRQGGKLGLGFNIELTDFASFGLGYLADDPEAAIGSDPYGSIAAFTFKPSDRVAFSLGYLYSYNNLDTKTGSDRANNPFRRRSDRVPAHSLALEASFEVLPNFILGGWLGWTQARALDLPGNPEAHILTYAVTLGFLDVGAEGNIAGLVLGQPPRVLDNDFKFRGQEYEDPDVAFHLEAFYTYRITDNIALTPGFIVVLNPEHDRANDTLYIGTVRAVFSF
jgi:Carbohydrate-selective porin, OprB family/S-layer homology domain